MQAGRLIIGLFKEILDFFFPRRCYLCGKYLEVEESLVCEQCDKKLPRTMMWRNDFRIDGKYMQDDFIFQEKSCGDACSAPKERSSKELFEENKLAKKFWGRLNVKRAMAYLKFYPHTATAQMVYDFKYHEMPWVALFLGRMMATELNEVGFFEGIDGLVPVPLTYSKRVKRGGYNQSYELARGVSQVTGIPIFNNVVKRTNYYISQTKLTSDERRQNISGAFALRKNAERLIAGKHLLLIDDVVTTGATTIECGRQMEHVDGTEISVLALAMVTLL